MLVHDSTFMEQEEFQNEIVDPILETMEDGEGDDFGRGGRNGIARDFLLHRRARGNPLQRMFRRFKL